MLSVVLVPAFCACLLAALYFLMRRGKKKDPIILCQSYISRALMIITETAEIGYSKPQIKKLDSMVNRAKLQCYFVAIEDALEINHATTLLKEAREITQNLFAAFAIIYDEQELKLFIEKVKDYLVRASEFIETTMNIPRTAPLTKVNKKLRSREQKAKDFLNSENKRL